MVCHSSSNILNASTVVERTLQIIDKYSKELRGLDTCGRINTIFTRKITKEDNSCDFLNAKPLLRMEENKNNFDRITSPERVSSH